MKFQCVPYPGGDTNVYLLWSGRHYDVLKVAEENQAWDVKDSERQFVIIPMAKDHNCLYAALFYWWQQLNPGLSTQCQIESPAKEKVLHPC